MKSILREKTLIRKMKKAYKSMEGIKLGRDSTGDWVIIDGGSWTVYKDVKSLSNKIKAMIVEIAGKLPELGMEAKYAEKEDMLEETECDVDMARLLNQERSIIYRPTFIKINLLSGIETRVLQAEGRSDKVYVREDDLIMIDYEMFQPDTAEAVGTKGPRSTANGWYVVFTDGLTIVSLETVQGEALETFANTVKALGSSQIEHMTYGV